MREEKTRKFTIKMQKKLVVLYLLVLLAFAGLSVRLIWITSQNEESYQKQVLAQQKYDSTTIPYRRGDIVDSKGTVLATSEKIYNLIVDAKVMLYEEAYLEPTLNALDTYFELDIKKIREYVVSHPSSSWYVALKGLSYEQKKAFNEAESQDENIKGVWFEEEYKRVYPYDSLAADVIGFAGKDNVGSYGLEEYYNDILNGVDGREYGYLNDDLNVQRTLKAAVDGNTIHSTIDYNLQAIVEKCLKKFNDTHANEYRPGNGAENVGCVMMNIHNGEILAMASYPTYDLNKTQDASALIGSIKMEQIINANGQPEIRKTNVVLDENNIKDLDSTQLYLNLNYLWKNYCITGTYEPGSTTKPFTVGAALESGIINDNSTFECPGYYEVGGHKIHCHNRYDGVLTLEQSVAKSCNVAMMKIALATGVERFTEFQQVFNFGLKTNIDLAGEARTASFVYTADKMRPADLATNGFGQNFNVTMVQMISGFCSLINGGYYYEPHMVNKITDASGATVKNIQPRLLKQTVSESTSELLRKYCEAVVEYGTGKTARPAGYMIGGKTGTAETIDPNTGVRSEEEFVVSFIGYAPADDPQIAVYAVVDRPNVAEQDDAKLATGIVRDVLTEALPYLNIFMTEELTEAEQAEVAARQGQN